MLAEQASSIEIEMPEELLRAAQRLANELAWPAAEAQQVVSWLGKQGCEIVGVELWREKDGQPQWIASSDFSPASDQSATQFIENCQNEPGALFNLAWLEPVKSKFDKYTRVRLETDRYQAKGVSRGDLGYVIEVFPGGNYEIEFSRPDGTTFAQITAKETDIQRDEPLEMTLPHTDKVLVESRNKQPLTKVS